MANEKRLNESDFRTILAFAENSMRMPETARSLFVHYNTVKWRISKIKEITGLDPQNFYDLCKLVKMARKEKR